MPAPAFVAGWGLCVIATVLVPAMPARAAPVAAQFSGRANDGTLLTFNVDSDQQVTNVTIFTIPFFTGDGPFAITNDSFSGSATASCPTSAQFSGSFTSTIDAAGTLVLNYPGSGCSTTGTVNLTWTATAKPFIIGGPFGATIIASGETTLLRDGSTGTSLSHQWY